MSFDGMKLICFDGEPHWLASDGSFVPVEARNSELYAPGGLYLKEKNQDVPRLIAG